MNIAIVRVRGKIRVEKRVLDTMRMVRLYRQNYCVVYARTPSLIGMLQLIKDYVTWGELDDETYQLLREKRGGENRRYFRLSPPRGGFERKGIKKSYREGGAVGYRSTAINVLLRRMM